jgi:hypothetical protein
MTNRTKTPTGADTAASEETRLRQIAARHALSQDGLVKFVADVRSHARNRRRRLADGQIEQLVRDLGADR